MPGPGQYDISVEKRGDARAGTQMSLKSNPDSMLQNRPRIVNPPSIPSHMNIFGYDENEMGQLIK